MVAEIGRRGHEVGSRSMTGVPAFGSLDRDAQRLEVVGSKVLLESLAGRRVEGFRSPGWLPGRELLEALIGAGYVYDSSVQPFVLPPFRRHAEIASGERGSLDLGPGVVRGERGALVELMGTATVGIPFNHAIRLAFPGVVSRLARRLACARRGSIGYSLHAMDVLGLNEDELDPALETRAGMLRTLDEKMEIASDSVARLSRARRIVPLKELVARDYGASARPSRVDTSEERD
jgi:hypothetical protein